MKKGQIYEGYVERLDFPRKAVGGIEARGSAGVGVHEVAGCVHNLTAAGGEKLKNRNQSVHNLFHGKILLP